MGVEGSPWKMFVDPVEACMCYYNFDTHEKIYDYKMKDKKLKAINIGEFVLFFLNSLYSIYSL